MTTATRTYRVGDKVTPDPGYPGMPKNVIGEKFTVIKVNKVNLRLANDAGGRGFLCPPEGLLPATEENLNKAFAPRPFVPMEFYMPGEIVTVASPSGKIAADTPMVVINDPGKDNVSIIPLGSTDGRYWRWPRKSITRRDVAWLTERLVEMA